MRAVLYTAIFTLLLNAAALSETRPSRNCAEEDMLTYVKGDRECIAIQVVGRVAPANTLIVFLHGDVSRGGPADYFAKDGTAAKVDTARVVTVNMIRLGYYTSDNRFSSGTNNRRRDNTTRSHNRAIAAAVQRLKDHYRAEKVVMVGHSAGALTIGAIIGQNHGLVDHAILVSCLCDTQWWARHLGRSGSERRQNPMKFAKRVQASTSVTAITGADDDITPIATARRYIAALQQHGIEAKLVSVPGAGHNFVGDLRRATISQTRIAVK